MLTFRDTGKEVELKGDLLKLITSKNYNVDLASLSDKQLLYGFAEEMNFDVKSQGKKSNWDKTLIKVLKSPDFMISAPGISNAIFLLSDPNELCDRLNIIIPEEQSGNSSDLNNEKNIAIVDKLLEYNCIFKKQHKQVLIKSNLLHTKKN